MLNLIWLGLLLIGVLVAGITGQFAAINQGALNAAKSAVMDVALPLCGAMTLWLGMVRLAENPGSSSRSLDSFAQFWSACSPMCRQIIPRWDPSS